MKTQRTVLIAVGVSLALIAGLLIGVRKNPNQEAPGLESPEESATSPDPIHWLAKEWPPSSAEEAAKRAKISQSAPALQGSLHEELRRLGEAASRRDRSEVEKILFRLIREHPGIGDSVLALYRKETLDKAESKGALLLLQVAIHLSRRSHPDGTQAFSEEGNLLTTRLIYETFPSTGIADAKLMALLLMPGVLLKEDLNILQGLYEERSGGVDAENVRSLLRSLLENLSIEDLAIAEGLLNHPDPKIRQISAEALLRLAPEQAENIAKQIPTSSAEQATALVLAICRYGPLDKIPGILANLGGIEPRGTGYSAALLQYLGRAGFDGYEKIYKIRGASDDTIPFRKDTTIAANLALRAHGIDRKKGLDFFSNVFRDDSSPQVRGVALLALANYWEDSDHEGFQAILNQARYDPGLEAYAKSAEAAFFKIPNPEDAELTKEAQSLSKKK